MRARPASAIYRRIRAGVRRLTNPRAHLPDRGRPPTQRPTVGLVGFHGWGNYGDELFVEVFRRYLGAPLRLQRVLDPRDDGGGRAAIRGRVRSSDVVLIGGGDLLVPWRRGRYWRDVYLERPVFVAGIGVPTNPTRPPVPEVVDHLRTFLRDPSVRSISARDPESLAWIREALEPTAPLLDVPDLACALRLPPVERAADPPIFGVAVRQRRLVDDLQHVQRLCRRALELGYRLRQIVLATGALRPIDTTVTRRLGFPEAELVASDDLDVISRAIGECTLFASMKFHGVVVAAMYGVPSIVLVRSAKTVRFAERIGRSDLLSSFNDPHLPELVSRDPPPLPAELPDHLRQPVVDYLAALRASILEAAAAGTPAAPR